MYCSNCGTDIPTGVRFCNSCGTAAGTGPVRHPSDPEGTRVAGQDTSRSDPEVTRYTARTPFDERGGAPARVEHLTAREPQSAATARTSFGVEPQHTNAGRHAAEDDAERVIFSIRPTFIFIGLGYALAALAAVGLIILLATFFTTFPPLYSVLVSLPLLLIPAFRHLRRNSVKYTVTDSKIEIDQGFVSRRTRNIPLRNIQDVTVSTSIPQRLLGFGDLIIENANEVGGLTQMRNIPDPRRHADLLLRELRRWN